MNIRPLGVVRAHPILHVPLLIGLLLGFAAPAAADEDIAIDQLPVAVVQAIQQRFPGAKLEEAERETDDGRTVYEVEIEVDGDDMEVKVTPEGQIVDVDD